MRARTVVVIGVCVMLQAGLSAVATRAAVVEGSTAASVPPCGGSDCAAVVAEAVAGRSRPASVSSEVADADAAGDDGAGAGAQDATEGAEPAEADAGRAFGECMSDPANGEHGWQRFDVCLPLKPGKAHGVRADADVPGVAHPGRGRGPGHAPGLHRGGT